MLKRRTAMLLAAISVSVVACGSTGQGRPAASSTLASSGPPSAQPPTAESTISAPPSAVTREAAIRVTGLALRADPAEAVGPCPLEVTFTATITVVGRGDVSYRWRSSDGDVSPVKTESFAGSGSKTVVSSWTVDATEVPTHAGWSSIELVAPSPGAVVPTAEPATFAFTCPEDNDVEAIGFGIGGSDADCSIAKTLATFAPDDHIRMVANYWPSLRAGTVVTFSLTREGVLVDGYPVTTSLDVSTKCVHGNVSNGHLATGHYRLAVEPDTARAITGEFDVR